MVEITTTSTEGTKKLGHDLALTLKPNDVLAVSGELGAGKTTFIQGLATGLGVMEFVSSPSFIIVNEYSGKMPLYHADLYRLEAGTDVESLGIEEYFERGGVTAIEWAERLGGLMPKKHIEIDIVATDENKRKITISEVK
jgi:tRNA threonylcarbamoyladenosine biosynthesis protein TsaE